MFVVFAAISAFVALPVVGHAQLPSLLDLAGGGGLENLLTTGDLGALVAGEKQTLLTRQQELAASAEKADEWRQKREETITRLDEVRKELAKAKAQGSRVHPALAAQLQRLVATLNELADRYRQLTALRTEEMQLISHGVELADEITDVFQKMRVEAAKEAPDPATQKKISLADAIKYADEYAVFRMDLALARSKESALTREETSFVPDKVDEDNAESTDLSKALSEDARPSVVESYERARQIQSEHDEARDRLAALAMVWRERQAEVAKTRQRVAKLEVIEKEQHANMMEKEFFDRVARVRITSSDLEEQKKEYEDQRSRIEDDIEKVRSRLFRMRNKALDDDSTEIDESKLTPESVRRLGIAMRQEQLAFHEMRREANRFRFESYLALFQTQAGRPPKEDYLANFAPVLAPDRMAARQEEISRRREARTQQLGQFSEEDLTGSALRLQDQAQDYLNRMIGYYAKQKNLLELEQRLATIVRYHLDETQRESRGIGWYLLRTLASILLVFVAGFVSYGVSRGMLFLAKFARPQSKGKELAIDEQMGFMATAQGILRTLTFLFYIICLFLIFSFAAWLAGQYLWDYDLGWDRLVRLKDETLFVFGKTPVTPIAILKLTSVIMVIGIVGRLIKAFLQRQVFSFFEWDEGVRHAISSVVRYLVLFIGLSIGLEFIGIGLETFAVLLGIVGIGIGFGLQKIATNFISGFIILFERPIKKGDWVTVGDLEGRVQDISVRVTKLRTRDNISVIIPNSNFISEQVVNWTYADHRVRLHLPVGVAYGSDVKKVERILLEVAKEHRYVLSRPEPVVYFKEFADSSLNFDLLFWTMNVRDRFLIVSEMNKRVDDRFRDEGVTIPFPQRDLWVKEYPPGKLAQEAMSADIPPPEEDRDDS
ncbi:MAG: mechanosensitive ion channel [Deltaproteobacteria bacterium]|nr:mechanosensitive ion channel [Deltaproteobacteria bacterium]MCB9489164.1 mechanosensitive ion channel [Deltaproteobacteria bacterium]